MAAQTQENPKLFDSSPRIFSFHNPVSKESLAIRNYDERTFYDHSQFQDSKTADKSVTLVSKYYQKEAGYIAQMNSILEEGKALNYTLYAFRSSGKAIPQVQSQNQENKMLIYEKTCQVLRPGIYRMIDLMTFHDKINSCFTEALGGIIPDVKDRDFFVSEAFLIILAKLLDLTISLDTMKNFKGSMSNDLSMYKRYAKHILAGTFQAHKNSSLTRTKRSKSMMPKDYSDPEVQVLPKLGFFLASKDQFANGLKTQLIAVNGYYEDIFSDMINYCCDSLETNHYLHPNIKHIYLRAMAFALTLIDGDTDNNDYNKKKKFKVERVGKLFKACSVVPLFGDIALSLGSIIGKAPHWNHAKWDLNRLEENSVFELQRSYLLAYNGDVDIIQYRFLMTSLKQAEFQVVYGAIDKISKEDSSAIFIIIQTAVKFLSSLTQKVMEQAAWKYLNPAQSPSVIDQDNQNAVLTSIYEQVVQFNYQAEEKECLLQYISMIKSLSGYLRGLEGKLQKIINKHIYFYIQGFAANQLTDMYNSAVKKKKPTSWLIKNIMDSLIDPQSEKGSGRFDPITTTQLYFTRSMLDYLFSEKSKGMKGGLMKEKTFKDSHIQELQQFYAATSYFPEMMELSETLCECSDLSNLWFKEFYLELTKQVQFRISTSLPWILANFALESRNTNLIQDIFVPLDLYNEAAKKTLYSLKSRYIYNEIEAELNLCFDQFMFKLSNSVFIHYKKLAAIRTLDAKTKQGIPRELNLLGGLQPDAFENVLKQKDIRLLGRVVSINKILSQYVHQYLRTSIDVAITRFEASNFSYISELESLIQVARLTHSLLSKHLELENFDDMVMEIDDCVIPGEINGRIIAHSIDELVKDVISTYRLNILTSRFLPGEVLYTDPVQRPKFPNAKVMYLYGSKGLSGEFENKYAMNKIYVGKRHFASLLNVVGLPGMAVLTSEITKHIQMIMVHTMQSFLEGVHELQPRSIQFPIQYETFGEMFTYLQKKSEKLAAFKLLKSEVLQAFREIGNAIMIIKYLEETILLDVSWSKLLIQDIVSYEPETPCYLNKFETLKEDLGDVDPNTAFGYSEWISLYKSVIRNPTSKSLISKRLIKMISSCLSNIPDFKENENLTELKSFVKIWSELSFTAALPNVGSAGDRKIREVFGDGLPVAGSVLTFVFGQNALFDILDINSFLVKFSKSDVEILQNPDNQYQQYLVNAEWFVKISQEMFSVFKNLKK